MNRRRFIIGLVLLAAGVGTAVLSLTGGSGETAHPAWSVLALGAGVLIIAGLALSAGELAKVVVKRIKEAHERKKANRDKQRQARRSKGRSASP